MSTNVERPRRYYGNSLQLTSCILDSGATCHTTPEISDFIPGSLAETYKYIEVADRQFITAKKRRISDKICGNNEKLLIATFYNVLFSPDLCDRIFSIITLMNSGNT